MATFKQRSTTGINVQDLSQFPSLPSRSENNSSSELPLDFLEVSKRVIPIKKPNQNILQPGWVALNLDENNCTVSTTLNSIPLNETSIFQKEVRQALSSMQNNWNIYQNNYIELNGEDMYYHYHSMPYDVELIDETFDEE
jgi:hypothetical protein